MHLMMEGAWICILLSVSILGTSYVHGQAVCRPTAPRDDCGYTGINQQGCENKGCCWKPTDGEPYCFYQSSVPNSYKVQTVSSDEFGMKMSLQAADSLSTPYGNLITPLAVDITWETNERLHVKIYDPYDYRWEIPSDISPVGEVPSTPPAEPLYKLHTSAEGEMFYFAVSRASDGEVLFNTSNSDQPLQFADQYLALSTILPGTESLYGLGEHKASLKLNKDRTYTLWSYDVTTPPDVNLYGSHPFYLDMRQSGKAHGVYLRNSNGMDVIYGDKYLTYRVIGGVLDFYYFLGPTPEGVIQQYQEVIGRPHLPPYWALGFHQCRFGYPNVEALQYVVDKYASNNIPLDTMWTDIEYMDGYRVFTLDPVNFALPKMTEFVDYLHNKSMKYVVIIDPGIKVDRGYKTYDNGLEMGVFIRDRNSDLFTGKVWPGVTTFPDFFNPAAHKYWTEEIINFYNTLLKFDGLWNDMNEISNFCNGECTGVSEPDNDGLKYDLNNPPYKINNQGDNTPLYIKTLDMDAIHYGPLREYDVHNLYGLMEAIPTRDALETVRGKRSFLLSRSTFPGYGSHGGHWTGDNHATYDDLYFSIPGMLSFQMFGIPLIGSDICGFFGDTTEELCSRWMELGAFYPFSRNHNELNAKPQEPYVWESVAAISRKYLGLRYELLPYYYTLFYKASRPVTSTPSATVTRPLFFEFPDDPNTYDIDTQFMVGNGLLISPVLKQGATTLDAYFPKGSKWYELYTGNVESAAGGATMTLNTPIDYIPVHVRGGTIIPGQGPGLTTVESRQTNHQILVALADDGTASGDLYIDDGESIKPTQWSFLTFAATQSGSSGEFTSEVTDEVGDPLSIPSLDKVQVYGVEGSPTKAYYNGEAIEGFSFNSTNQVLSLTNFKADLTTNFKITWE